MSVTVTIGDLRQTAKLFGPGAVVPDGDGGYTQEPVPLTPPEWRCSIAKASARASERRFAATVTSQATHIFSGRYHPGVTVQTTLTWIDRAGVEHSGTVLDFDDTEGAGVELVVLVSEVRS